MAAGTTIKHKRKSSAFTSGELSAGEFGLNTNNGVWYYSTDGTAIATVVMVDDTAYNATTWDNNLDAPTKNAVRDKFESLSSGGIARTVVTTSGSLTLGATASTDYIYFVAGAHTLSMPAASGNTNRYTIKNNHSAAITVDTAGAENIEGAASLSLQPNDAIDVVSDSTNWFVV